MKACSDVLVIQPLSGIGDMVWHLPFLAPMNSMTIIGGWLFFREPRRWLADPAARLLAGTLGLYGELASTRYESSGGPECAG